MCECSCEPRDEAAEKRRAEWRQRHGKRIDAIARGLIAASAAGAAAVGAHGAADLGVWIGATAATAALALTMLPSRTAWPVTFGTLFPAWGVAFIALALAS